MRFKTVILPLSIMFAMLSALLIFSGTPNVLLHTTPTYRSTAYISNFRFHLSKSDSEFVLVNYSYNSGNKQFNQTVNIKTDSNIKAHLSTNPESIPIIISSHIPSASAIEINGIIYDNSHWLFMFGILTAPISLGLLKLHFYLRNIFGKSI